MKEKETQSNAVISIISAAIIILILALFGKSQAAGLLEPINDDNLQISVKSHVVKVVVRK